MATTHKIVSESAQRLGAKWQVPWETEKLRCLFILLLEKDLTLKELVLKGTETVGPLESRKAEAFFLALTPQLIESWMRNESRGSEDFLSKARNLYLVC